MQRSRSITTLAIACVTGFASSQARAQVTIPTVPIGNPGNAADPFTGRGSVDYTYNIGQTEVTNAQYVAFLNAKAASDVYGLYHPAMSGSHGGINRSGSAGSYTYSAINGRDTRPVGFVSFWETLRFANWLHNGQGDGDTETGADTLTLDGIESNSVLRNSDARWALTNEDEWYKAAYHQPRTQGGDIDDYWLYPTSSNTITTDDANFRSGIGFNTPVGSYAANFYGTFDMAGNVSEWNESIAGVFRGYRGGSYSDQPPNNMRADTAQFGSPSTEYGSSDHGFRVCQVPGPSSLGSLAVAALGTRRRTRSLRR